jgi:hypothetical protein
MPADWATDVVSSALRQPCCYALVAEDMLALQSDRLMCGAERFGAYDALVHWMKVCFDEGVHRCRVDVTLRRRLSEGRRRVFVRRKHGDGL